MDERREERLRIDNVKRGIESERCLASLQKEIKLKVRRTFGNEPNTLLLWSF